MAKIVLSFVPLALAGCLFGSTSEIQARSEARSANQVSLSSAKVYVGDLVLPVRGAKVTSPFGSRWLSFHEGIDLAVSEGTKIRAAHSGLVVYSNDGISGYGNLIAIQGKEGLMTVYGHNKENFVKRGDRVAKGEVIGLVGHTGDATGSHLHFETRIKNDQGKNVAVDPGVFYPVVPLS